MRCDENISYEFTAEELNEAFKLLADEIGEKAFTHYMLMHSKSLKNSTVTGSALWGGPIEYFFKNKFTRDYVSTVNGK